MRIEPIIYSKLSSISLGADIFPLVAPEGHTGDAVLYYVKNMETVDHLGGSCDIKFYYVVLDCFSEIYDNLIAIVDKLYLLFDETKQDHLYFKIDDEMDSYDIDVREYRKILTVRVLYNII